MAKKFTLYTFAGSQWAGVAHLALAHKGFNETDYDLEEVDLVAADNFSPEYLRINPYGTVPSLTSTTLDVSLTDSTDILRYVDSLRPGDKDLVPQDTKTTEKVRAILDLVHSDDVGTNLILLQARNRDEMECKKASDWKIFVTNRQERLEKELAAHPEHPFYEPKANENRKLYELYVNDIGPQHADFFAKTHEMYRKFAAGVSKLEALLVLPYAAGETITEADWHIVPWLAHAMAGSGTEPIEIENFEPLEKLIQISVPEFTVGPKLRQWWANVAATESFKKVFPVLH